MARQRTRKVREAIAKEAKPRPARVMCPIHPRYPIGDGDGRSWACVRCDDEERARLEADGFAQDRAKVEQLSEMAIPCGDGPALRFRLPKTRGRR